MSWYVLTVVSLLACVALFSVAARFATFRRSAFALSVAFLLLTFYCMARGVGQDNNTYANKCHDRGGVVTHDGCFKPGSEIHVP